MAAIDAGGATLTGRGAPTRVQAAEVSASFFDVLRVRPALGRSLRSDENESGHTKVAVLGDRLWRQRFGADPAVIGQTLLLNREPLLIVGVAPAGFSYPEGTELWTPLEYDTRFRSKSRGAWYLSVVARLKPGVPASRARDEVATIGERLARDYPDANEGVGGTLLPLQESLVGGSRTALLVLFGAVGLVLLVACVNVANLILARMAARETELAVRSALGAGRGRLLRQLLTESVLLSLLGGAAGLLLASASLDTLLGLQPEGLPRLAEVKIDRVVAAFATLLSLSTGILFGIFPALQMTHLSTAQALREAGRGLLSGRGARLRGGLVVGQMALALVLLAGAGLLLRSFVRLSQVDPGFRTESALTFRISLPETAYPSEARREAFLDDLLGKALRPAGGARIRCGRGPSLERDPLQHLLRGRGAAAPASGAAALARGPGGLGGLLQGHGHSGQAREGVRAPGPDALSSGGRPQRERRAPVLSRPGPPGPAPHHRDGPRGGPASPGG